MRILIALGGNALLRRGEPLTLATQIANIRRAAAQIARLALDNQLIVTHGNGPQVGLLALQAAAADHPACPTPLDVLDAESEGMVGYLLEQELTNALQQQGKGVMERAVVTLLTRVEVSINDPAFTHPTKPIGPIYTSKAQADELAARHGWRFSADGAGFRRVVASPKPQRILEPRPVRWLLEQDAIVIAAGGGGIPVARAADGKTWLGVEAVIDKDLCSALLAIETVVDLMLIVTDVDAVYVDWGGPHQRALREVSVAELRAMPFAAGSMGPKVEAACQFVEQTGHAARIGSLEQIEAMLKGVAGTRVKR